MAHTKPRILFIHVSSNPFTLESSGGAVDWPCTGRRGGYDVDQPLSKPAGVVPDERRIPSRRDAALTALREAYESLREQEAFLRTIGDTLPKP
jgi:hypothetical protein